MAINIIDAVATPTAVISCRRSNRVYLVTDQIKVTKPRRQYYTDDWRWQMGIIKEIFATCCTFPF